MNSQVLNVITSNGYLLRRTTVPRIAILLLATASLFVGGAQAQESLRDVIQSQGVEWIMGHWTGTNAQGRTVVVEYEYEVAGHAIEVDLTIGEDGYKGMIFYRPMEGDVIEVGADSRGAMVHSTWRVEDGAVITDRTNTRPSGQVIRVTVINKQVDANTVVATMHLLSAEGERGETALENITLTRVTEPPEGE